MSDVNERYDCPPEGCQGLEPPARSMKPLAVSLGIVALLLVFQIVGWVVTGSLVVAFDALHMLVDLGAIGIGMFGIWLARRPATGTRSWGYLRVEILGALLNGALLIGMTLLLAKEAFERLTATHATPDLPPKYMFIFGGVALGLNLVNLFVLSGGHAHAHEHDDHNDHDDDHDHKDHHADLNYQGVLLHMISDVLGSLGVVVAAAVIYFTGWKSADAVIALVMSVLIFGREVLLCFRAVDVLLESTPRHVDVAAFEDALRRVEQVEEVHDLHIWTLTSGVYAMSCHAKVAPGADHAKVLRALKAVIVERFGIDHTTIQLEDHAPATAT
jgi:cobalt-zinc-cadmium efflux system protein